mmetsp:Transcript_18051/g.22104  ORF Transcript_18051/g.22104 Transcript_18051/m.22104 type:complete len:106 (-) Transcript_18051:832-1149(-)
MNDGALFRIPYSLGDANNNSHGTHKTYYLIITKRNFFYTGPNNYNTISYDAMAIYFQQKFSSRVVQQQNEWQHVPRDIFWFSYPPPHCTCCVLYTSSSVSTPQME